MTTKAEESRLAVENLMDVMGLNSTERTVSIIVDVVGPLVDLYTELITRQAASGMADGDAYLLAEGVYVPMDDGEAEADAPPGSNGSNKKMKVKSVGQRKREIAEAIERAKDAHDTKVWDDVKARLLERPSVQVEREQQRQQQQLQGHPMMG